MWEKTKREKKFPHKIKPSPLPAPPSPRQFLRGHFSSVLLFFSRVTLEELSESGTVRSPANCQHGATFQTASPPIRQINGDFSAILYCDISEILENKHVMYQSNRSFNIPARQPPGHLKFWKIFVQIPPSLGRKAVQMPPPSGKLPDYCFNFSDTLTCHEPSF